MKKLTVFAGIAGVLVIGMILSGCASNSFVYDKYFPEEQTCLLKIHEDLTVARFNGKRVKWKTNGWGISFRQNRREAIARIPAGDHIMTVNYFHKRNDGLYTYTTKADGIEIKQEFLPGNTYELSPLVSGDRVVLVIRRE